MFAGAFSWAAEPSNLNAAGQPVSPGFSAMGMIAVATSVTTTALQ
jgi:hypothetical protein